MPDVVWEIPARPEPLLCQVGIEVGSVWLMARLAGRDEDCNEIVVEEGSKPFKPGTQWTRYSGW
jgi:hypothetical protein